ncbi:MAG: S24/S26 family peptidase [Clostridia bacterium]|nr:S24/S26 family peptidase [Clostridia bacterium]
MNKQLSLEEYLRENGSLTYSNVGVSMLPLLRQGRDLLTLQAKGQARCKVGDVALFRRESGQLVLHRIVAVRDADYVLRGDNCTGDEPGVTDAQILGVMTGYVRGGRTHSITEPRYRLYSYLILHTARLRIPILKVRHRIRRRLWRLLKAKKQ